ncbi:unnamed protein product [Ilex paraguariensis]|uniref:Uncharacterized protein n=1 Tax=Ilex paraguariensis TaxID=185542 RepID=A0ABC8V267_9AQUA
MKMNARKSLSFPEDTESCVTSEGSKGEANKATEASSGKDGSSRTKGRDGVREKKTVYVAKDEVKVEEGVDGDTEDDDERMISHQEGENFPGSPSFRVYFLDNLKDGDDGDGE